VKDETTKYIIKYIKRKQREAYRNLGIVKAYQILTVLIIACFGVSYVCNMKELSWYSSLFQSCGVGVVTGMVIYILGNIRVQKKENVDKKVEQLSVVHHQLEVLYNAVPSCAEVYFEPEKSDYTVELIAVIDAGIEYIKAVKCIDNYIFRELIEEVDVDIQKIESELERLRKEYIYGDLYYTFNEANNIKHKIIEYIQGMSLWLDNQLREAEIQQNQLRRYPL